MDLFWKIIVYIAGGVALYFAYRRARTSFPGKPVAEAIVSAACITAAFFAYREWVFLAVAIAILWIGYRIVASVFPKKPVGQVTIFILCIAAALLFEEGWIRILPSQLDSLYKMNYAIKWEFFSLLAATILTKLYWQTLLDGVLRIEQPYVKDVINYGRNIWLSLGLATLLLLLSLLVPNKPLRFGLLIAHFVVVVYVAYCFLVVDRATWKGFVCERDKNNDLKHISALTYFLADWPMLIALSLLGVFFLIHWPEHGYVPSVLIPYLHSTPKVEEQIDVWDSEEYFMAGAIAFQFLLSTSIYLILALGVVQIGDIVVELPPQVPETPPPVLETPPPVLENPPPVPDTPPQVPVNPLPAQ